MQFVQNLHKLQMTEKNYQYKFYALSAIIAVGYRINSGRTTQFRQWATKVLDTFTKQGYVLDKGRLINGQIFDEDYFDQDKGKVTATIAKAFAESEFEKYRVIQDCLYQSDFDRLIADIADD